MIPLTITDLKKHLGPGLGLRKSKYMLEIPVPGKEGETLNILCRSTAFPERNIGTVSVFNKGRKYNMRSETAYPGTYSISIIDDSNMALRWLFDGWLDLVDDSRPDGSFVHSSASYEKRPFFSLGQFGEGGQSKYQTDINIWQLGNQGEKVYGYKLQNAFPSSVGIVELDDSDETTLSEFSVVFTYSETIPLKPSSSNSVIIPNSLSDPLLNPNSSTRQTNPFSSVQNPITSDDLTKISEGQGNSNITNSINGLHNITNNSNGVDSLNINDNTMGNIQNFTNPAQSFPGNLRGINTNASNGISNIGNGSIRNSINGISNLRGIHNSRNTYPVFLNNITSRKPRGFNLLKIGGISINLDLGV